jgi:hydrocephalus-inducing protein
VDNRIEVEVPCKTNHTQQVSVANWLNQRQRFEVRLSLADKDSLDQDAVQGLKMNGLDVFDLPPKLKRDYKFSVYSYKQMNCTVIC